MAYNSNVTATDVTDIFDTGLSNATIDTWIAVAEERVGDLPTHDDLTSGRKDKIVKFLAASMATAQDPRADTEEHESFMISYGGERRTYGELAALLDPTDTLGRDGTEAFIGTFEVR